MLQNPNETNLRVLIDFYDAVLTASLCLRHASPQNEQAGRTRAEGLLKQALLERDTLQAQLADLALVSAQHGAVAAEAQRSRCGWQHRLAAAPRPAPLLWSGLWCPHLT